MKINGGHNYKIDDKQLTHIINKNVKPVNSEFSIEFNIFAKFEHLRILLLKITLMSLHVNLMLCFCNKWECTDLTEQTLQRKGSDINP